MSLRTSLALLFLAGALAGPASSQWSTGLGGNPSRNGRSRGVGPVTDSPTWSAGVHSQIVLHPLVAGELAITMHVTDWTSEQGSWIVAHELATGRRVWSTQLPPSASGLGSWSRPLAARDGRIYAARGTSGPTDEELVALSAEDGSILWIAEDLVDVGLSGTPTFLPGGDLVVSGRFLGSFTGYDHLRIDAATGQTVWQHARFLDPEDGGGTALGDRLYLKLLTGGGIAVQRLDPATGLGWYASPSFPSDSNVSGPIVVAPDGTVLALRRRPDQSCVLIALDDTGSALVSRWTRDIGPLLWSNVGVGPDGSIYALSADDGLVRLDPADGSVRDRTAALVAPDPVSTCRVAIDDAGTVYALLTPVWDGELFAFDADLDPLWSRSLVSSPFGGPTLAPDGTLLVATVGEGLVAWR